MTTALIFLSFPEAVRSHYEQALRGAFPELKIRTAATVDEAAGAIEGADVLLTFGAMMQDRVFDKADSLKWVHAIGTGVDGITDAPSLGAGVMVSSTKGIHGAPMSEMAFLLMLALSRGLPRILKAQDECRWDRWPGRLLDSKTAGILGVGGIAEELAPRLKAFGMQVIGISRSARPVAGIDRFHSRDDLAGIAGELDYLIVLVPYEPATHNLVDAAVLAAMKPAAYLINIARGGVVDEEALVQALNGGRLAGAGLDTFVSEPLPPGHALWKAPNTIITPHLGGFNDAYADKALPQIITNMRLFLDGEYGRMINLESRP